MQDSYPAAVRRALVEEIECRKLTHAAIVSAARDAGYRLSTGRVSEVLRGTAPNPSVGTVAAIVVALGKDWRWLGREVERHRRELAPCDPIEDIPL